MLELRHGLDLHFGEKALTDLNLLSLANRVSEDGIPIRVVQVTQNLERRLGADFEFWLQLEAGGYLAYSLQAKKVYLYKGRLAYPRLSEREGLGGPLQYEALLAHAASVGSIAMHIFFNGWRIG